MYSVNSPFAFLYCSFRSRSRWGISASSVFGFSRGHRFLRLAKSALLALTTGSRPAGIVLARRNVVLFRLSKVLMQKSWVLELAVAWRAVGLLVRVGLMAAVGLTAVGLAAMGLAAVRGV